MEAIPEYAEKTEYDICLHFSYVHVYSVNFARSLFIVIYYICVWLVIFKSVIKVKNKSSVYAAVSMLYTTC